MPAADPGSLRVRDAMTVHAATVAPDDTVARAVEIMNDSHVAALPVVDEADRCRGILSASDILTLAEERGARIEQMATTDGLARELLLEHFDKVDLSDTLVTDLMTPTPLQTSPDTALAEAARTMIDRGVHHIVVAERRDRFLGILSSMDIVRAVAEGGGR